MVAMWDREGIEVLLFNNDGSAPQALPIVSGSFSASLSAVGESSVNVSQKVVVDNYKRLRPWESTIALVVAGQPVWSGTVVKRRSEAGAVPQELTLREWSTLLDKTWDTEGWPLAPPWTFDAATALHNRFEVAWDNQPNTIPALPLLSGDSGLNVDLEFLDQSDETSPQFLSGDLQQIVDLGVDWRMSPQRNSVTEEITLGLDVFQLDTAPVAEINVGVDAATVELSVDTDPQATKVRVVAEGETWVDVDDGVDGIEVWRVFNYDRLAVATGSGVDYDTLLTELGQALLQRVGLPVLMATDLKLVGLRTDIRVGDVVRVRVPDAFDRQRDFDEIDMRVSDIAWDLSSSDLSTNLTLVSTEEALQPNDSRTVRTATPSASRGLAPLLVEMNKRISALEARR